ncbi:MAG: 3-deoxy-manno-octulosonate cytidylyltransferase [bacterium]|nr:3-deoxy-manno-octulosonate cytidylyltransferase [bacterium]
MRKTDSVIVAAIPARWASTRFPGKPLALIGGEPMIAHAVRSAASATSITDVLVATDDERIATAAQEAGAEAILTGEHSSGTDRIAEALFARDDWTIAINVQGDEPFIAGANIDTLVEGMLERPDIGMATLCRPLDALDVEDPNAVKVVRARDGEALYFSRSVIPFPRNQEVAQSLWSLHLGIYGFTRPTLEQFVDLGPSSLERAESLEQLRALENGIQTLVLEAPFDSRGIDTPEDLKRAEQEWAEARSVHMRERK